MQTEKIENGAPVAFDELLKGIQKLDDQALATVAGEVTRLLSKRNPKPPANRETELLKKIQTVIPAAIKRRQKQLYSQLQQESLTHKEHEELLLLNHLLEEKSAERILFVGELARIRGISAQEMTAEFKKKTEHAPT